MVYHLQKSFKFTPLIKGFLGILIFSRLGIALAVEAPQDAYLLAYTQIGEADLLMRSGQTEEARRKYEVAWHQLKRIEAECPDWEPSILRYRLQYLSEKLGHQQPPLNPAARRAPLARTADSNWGKGSSPPALTILEIEYSSRREDMPLNEDKIRQNMRSTKGSAYSGVQVDQDIRDLYATGDYENVQIQTSEFRSEEGGRGVRLEVLVDPKPVLTEVALKRKTNDGKIDDDLALARRELPLEDVVVGKPVGGSLLHRQADRWETTYREHGFYEVRITPWVETQGGGMAKVVFQIEEGPRRFIRRISFSGNQHIPNRDLEKILQLKPRRIWSARDVSNCYDSGKAEMDQRRILDLYQNRGFLDARVTQKLEKTPEGLILQYDVEEGVRYGVEKITLEGVHNFKENEILKELRENSRGKEIFDPENLKMVKADGLLRGRAYSAQGLQASIETLQDWYGQNGFREAKVSARVREAGGPKQALQVDFEIQEGNRHYVDRVTISGNKKIPDSEIRSLLALGPGDVFDTSREKKSKEDLMKSGYYQKIETYAEETDRPYRYNLVFEVLEKPQELSFGLGVSYIWQGGPQRGFVLATPFPALISFNLSAGWGMAWMQAKKIVQEAWERRIQNPPKQRTPPPASPKGN